MVDLIILNFSKDREITKQSFTVHLPSMWVVTSGGSREITTFSVSQLHGKLNNMFYRFIENFHLDYKADNSLVNDTFKSIDQNASGFLFFMSQFSGASVYWSICSQTLNDAKTS